MGLGKRWRRLLRYARSDRSGWVVIAVLTVVSTALSIAQPWPMQILVDHVLESGDRLPRIIAWLPGVSSPRLLLVWVVGAGLILFAANAFIEVSQSVRWARTGQRTVYALAGDLFSAVQRRSLREHYRSSVGESLSRITGDSWCVYGMVDTLLFTPARAVLTIIITVSLMACMSGRLTLWAVAVAPIMAGISLGLGRHFKRIARARREIESKLTSHVQQTLSGLAVVQGFGQEQREAQRFVGLAGQAISAQRRTAWLNSLSNLGTGLAVTLGTGVVLLIGAREVAGARLTVGQLLVFVAYVNSLQGQFSALASAYLSAQSLSAQADRALEVLEGEIDVKESPAARALGAVRGEVRLEDVTFGYVEGRAVLRGVNVTLRPGEVVAIVGPSGAGKSTLAGLLPRFFDPSKGRVLLDGQDLRELKLNDVRRNVGIVLQEAFLLPISIAQNIAYGRPEASIDEIKTAARAAGAGEFIEALAEGYDTVIGEGGCTLSGGQRQRLSIARALLKNAPVLVLDEPTSALDTATEAAVLDALERLMAGRTVLMIAHRLSTVRRADRIVVLDQGEVVEEGTHEALLARNGLYSRLCASQNLGASPHAGDAAFDQRQEEVAR